jgi:formyltetrahydrofolate deformylase
MMERVAGIGGGKPALGDRGRLVVACPDRAGIVAAVSRFLFERGANIVHSDQHTTDPVGGRFFLRVEFDLPDLARRADETRAAFEAIAADYGMAWRLTLAAAPRRLAVFVSGEDHCLQELLWQQRAGDLRAEIALVVGNHAAMAAVTAPWGVPFHHVPVAAAGRAEAEARQLALLDGAGVELVVLARYMQILSPAFVGRWRHAIINITTPSCPPSSAPSRTPRPTPAASS